MIPEENKDMVTKLMLAWTMAELQSGDDFNPIIDEIHEEDFICQVLTKRMEAFKLGIIVPDYLSLILSFCTEGNPGKSLYLLYEILKETTITSLPYTIKSIDFAKTYPMSFPYMEGLFDEEYSRKWDSQKDEDGNNKVDTPDFWKEAIGKELYNE